MGHDAPWFFQLVVNLLRGKLLDLTGKASLIQALTDERDWLRQRVLLLETQLREQTEQHSKELLEILDRFRPKPGSTPIGAGDKNRPATRFPSDRGISRPDPPAQEDPRQAELAIARHLGHKIVEH